MLIKANEFSAYVSSLSDLLQKYFAVFPEDRQRLTVLSEQVEQRSPALCDRKGLPGHLTASALVCDVATRNFLLIHHNFLKRWLQPGGHMDYLEDPLSAALRELEEEAGQMPVRVSEGQERLGVPIDIDSHRIPPNEKKHEVEHLHHDLQFLFVVEKQALVTLQEEEVCDFRWVSFEEVERGDFGARLARTAAKITRLSLLPV